MDALLASADAAGIWTIQSSVFPENEATLALHERVGFRVVGRRERIAQQNGTWRDTVLLERRSASIR
jgi:phosphinothricin acetyltransferase